MVGASESPGPFEGVVVGLPVGPSGFGAVNIDVGERELQSVRPCTALGYSSWKEELWKDSLRRFCPLFNCAGPKLIITFIRLKTWF